MNAFNLLDRADDAAFDIDGGDQAEARLCVNDIVYIPHLGLNGVVERVSPPCMAGAEPRYWIRWAHRGGAVTTGFVREDVQLILMAEAAAVEVEVMG